MSTEILKLTLPHFEVTEISTDWIERRNKLLAEASQIKTISNQDDYEAAEILLKKITGASGEAEKLRKKLSKPFTDFSKKIKKMGDDARGPLEDNKQKLKRIMADFLNAAEMKRQEEMQKALEEEVRQREEVEANNPFAAFTDPVVKTLPGETTTPAAPIRKNFSSARKVWKFEIENEILVSREFCSPDEKKIRDFINNEKNEAEIPGVRIYEETIVQSR